MDDVMLILFGATGDLSKRKIIPAVYELLRNNKAKITLVCIVRSEHTKQDILDDAKTFVANVDENSWQNLISSTHHMHIDFYKQEDYKNLKSFLSNIEKEHKLSGNRIYYFATPADAFDVITDGLSKYAVVKNSSKKFSRVVFEKPFGHDLESAKYLNKCINRIFKERQIYRIDHYLGKELVGNIAMIRFTNRVLEPLWNAKNIESVQIVMTETIGVENRGKFYDKYGAIKDVVQNHALQLLALTAMESPKMLTGDYIRNQKSKVLKNTKIIDALIGQYDSYRNEPGVNPNSNTETFAALKIEINTKRWKNVPFFIKVGKGLDSKNTGIHVKFRHVSCLLSKTCPADTNYFDIRVQPDAGFSLELNAKTPGQKYEVIPVKMDFLHEQLFANTPEAYELLIEDVINGDQSLFVRDDEIENSWKIIDDLYKDIISKNKPHNYFKGSIGPVELADWDNKNDISWRR